jgi:hypothetical protein
MVECIYVFALFLLRNGIQLVMARRPKGALCSSIRTMTGTGVGAACRSTTFTPLQSLLFFAKCDIAHHLFPLFIMWQEQWSNDFFKIYNNL